MIKIYADIVQNPTLPEMFPNFCCATSVTTSDFMSESWLIYSSNLLKNKK